MCGIDVWRRRRGGLVGCVRRWVFFFFKEEAGFGVFGRFGGLEVLLRDRWYFFQWYGYAPGVTGGSPRASGRLSKID